MITDLIRQQTKPYIELIFPIKTFTSAYTINPTFLHIALGVAAGGLLAGPRSFAAF